MHYLEGRRLLIWHAKKKRMHLGDGFACVLSGIYVAKQHNLKSIQLAVADAKGNVEFTRSLLSFIDYGDLDVSIVPVDGSEEISVRGALVELGVPEVAQLCFYDARYCEPKIKRVPVDQIKKKICYCWDAIYRQHQVPQNINLLEEALREKYNDYEFVKLGLPKTIEEDFIELSDCYFYIGFDSGVAHLCRMIQAPLFILGQSGGFPEHACERKMLNFINRDGSWINKEELLQDIEDYLIDIS